MTRREQNERATAIRDQIRCARRRLGDAIAAVDYEQALEAQVQIDGLEMEQRHIARRDSHTLFPPREASYGALSMLFSGQYGQSGSDQGGS
jgi:hypothetical protein